jgi:hypothetical protein
MCCPEGGAARRHDNQENELNLRRITVGAGVAIAVSTLGAAPAFAHDCFNPNKKPGAGVNYTITSFDEATGEPTFTQTGPGKGQGGFAAFDPSLTGGVEGVEVHVVGNNPHGVAGGPGSQTAEHACDGKGIDYLDACFGE